MRGAELGCAEEIGTRTCTVSRRYCTPRLGFQTIRLTAHFGRRAGKPQQVSECGEWNGGPGALLRQREHAQL